MAVGTAAMADTAYPSARGGDPTVHHRNVPDEPIWRNRDFWRNEAERSGLPEFWQGTKDFFRNLNPIPWLNEQRERFESRRVTNDVGNAAEDAGYATRDAARNVGNAAQDATRNVGYAAQDAGRAVSDAGARTADAVDDRL